ncbi:MAG: hypothetical protein ACLSTV_09685 [Coriobacteriales bacterium]|jgi:hypothetical protein
MKRNNKDFFPVGFWNYTAAGYVKDVRAGAEDWKTLGMNVAMSSVCKSEEDKEYILKSLDAAYEQGIKMIVCDKRTCWLYYTEHGGEAYKKAVLNAVKDFGAHPAFFAFSVGDEPHLYEWEDMKNAVKIVNSVSTAFINFLPLFDENGPEWEGITHGEYVDLLADTVKETGLFCLCYDCYSQCEYHFGEKDINEYFKNLSAFKRAAEKAGVPLWTTLLSVGHWRYRTPDIDDIRWQIYTAVSHGVNGILWFFIYERDKDSSYRQAPINLFFEKTPLFYILSDENRMFLKYYADNFIGARLKRVYHKGKVYADYKEYVNGVIEELSFTGEYGASLIVSEFENESGAFVCITNNEQRDIEHLTGEYKSKKFDEWFASGQLIVLK